MIKIFNPKHLDLQLFADGAGAGDGGTGAVGQGETGVAALPQTKGAKNNPLADVKYGIQEDAQAASVQEKVTDADGKTTVSVDRNAEFDKLINGDYKDMFDSKVQNILQKRLKGTRETVEKYERLAPMLDMLSKKYGIDANDTEGLTKAIEDDDAYYEAESMETGIPVEQLKEMKRMERQNAELKEQLKQRNAREQMAVWMNQADQLKSIYPGFNFDAEIENKSFAQLLRAGVDVRTAFEVVHKDEIMPAAMQYTAKTVEQKLTNKIIANGARPTENGMNSQSAAVVKSDVSQLSKADRQEIIRRVARGEKIRF